MLVYSSSNGATPQRVERIPKIDGLNDDEVVGSLINV
jgi:hypothetical protein